ncbi:hypothetical protein [Cecembia calidifontis]|uniref:hypothetical protein n=1 Tax=Cecembia calidifontis TaxID=1187080 RepID=UPI001F5F978C|nr:hypothetical protein [Cecembia calidifontis]
MDSKKEGLRIKARQWGNGGSAGAFYQKIPKSQEFANAHVQKPKPMSGHEILPIDFVGLQIISFEKA